MIHIHIGNINIDSCPRPAHGPLQSALLKAFMPEGEPFPPLDEQDPADESAPDPDLTKAYDAGHKAGYDEGFSNGWDKRGDPDPLPTSTSESSYTPGEKARTREAVKTSYDHGFSAGWDTRGGVQIMPARDPV